MLTNRSPDGRGQVGFPAMTPLAAASLAGLLGLAAGSFANVVIDRVPRRGALPRPGARGPARGGAPRLARGRRPRARGRVAPAARPLPRVPGPRLAPLPAGRAGHGRAVDP